MVDVACDETLRIARLELGPYGANCYVIVCRVTGDSIIVDAPAEPRQILKALENTSPRYIVITHSHRDHIGALRELKDELGVPIAMHPLDSKDLAAIPEVNLGEGDHLEFGQLRFKVLHTPGHTPGSICLLSGRYLISGDTIFPGGPGKTQTPAGFAQLVESILKKIFVLPDDTEVFPGHGTGTVLAREKREYAIFASKPHDPDLCGDVLWLSS